jgi:hypothetical protein
MVAPTEEFSMRLCFSANSSKTKVQIVVYRARERSDDSNSEKLSGKGFT